MHNHSDSHHPYVKEITEALVREYGRPTLGNKRNPLDEMLYIILSSRTPPDNYQGTYLALKRKFPRADSLANCSPGEIAEAIEQGGLQNKKANTIAAIAARLKETFGRVTLASLHKMETQEAEDFLVSLPGVGKKTARCVLMYALDRPVFPVDRHCFRVAERLGWLPKGAQLADRTADVLQEGIPAPLRRDLHVGMVILGRKHCFAQNPNCDTCPLLAFCPTSCLRSDEVCAPSKAPACEGSA